MSEPTYSRASQSAPAVAGGRPLAPTFWLYVAAQAIFLGFFGGVLTMKMAVLLEQTLMAVMVIAIASRGSAIA